MLTALCMMSHKSALRKVLKHLMFLRRLSHCKPIKLCSRCFTAGWQRFTSQVYSRVQVVRRIADTESWPIDYTTQYGGSIFLCGTWTQQNWSTVLLSTVDHLFISRTERHGTRSRTKTEQCCATGWTVRSCRDKVNHIRQFNITGYMTRHYLYCGPWLTALCGFILHNSFMTWFWFALHSICQQMFSLMLCK